jgi:hypothetical protein
MNTAIRILLLGRNRVKGFLLVALLVSLGVLVLIDTATDSVDDPAGKIVTSNCRT